MSTNALTRRAGMLPSFVGEIFNPWNEWFDNGFEKALSVPAVNVTEDDSRFMVSVAAPGMKKDDFKITVDGDVLTISAEKEEATEDNNKQYNRREYNYASFSRSFTLPEQVKQDKIEGKYEDGVLKLLLPKSGELKASPKTIAIK